MGRIFWFKFYLVYQVRIWRMRGRLLTVIFASEIRESMPNEHNKDSRRCCLA